MVDQVGAKPVSSGERVGRVARTTASRPVETSVRADAQAPATGFRRVAQELAAQAPVDTDRVARIRRAIQEGRFPLSPATIADRLLALKMDWTGNEQG